MKRALFLVFVMLGQVSAQSLASAKVSGSANTAAITVTQVAAPAATAGYIIGPEDVLKVEVWKESDLSGSVPVRPDGKISLPLLNDVQAAGLTPEQLAAKIADGLKLYLSAPHVTVIVTAMNSRRAYVMGQVAKQGAVLLISDLNVLQALAAAGGPVEFANTKKIYILRTAEGKQQKLPFNYNAVIKGKNPEQNVILKPGDTIVVP